MGGYKIYAVQYRALPSTLATQKAAKLVEDPVLTQRVDIDIGINRVGDEFLSRE